MPVQKAEGGRRKGWSVSVIGVGVVLAVGLGFVAGRVLQPPVSPKPHLASRGQADPLAADADFIITNALLANPSSRFELEIDVMGTTVCQGGTLRVANASDKTVGLVYAPDESDVKVELGIVRPGGVFTIQANELGVFFILEAERNGMMFRFDVKDCQLDSPRCCLPPPGDAASHNGRVKNRVKGVSR